MSKRVVFTGGTGKAGRHVLAYLAAHGYELLNIDLAPLDQANLKTLIADITDGGQVFNALSTHFRHGRPQDRRGATTRRCGRSFRGHTAHPDQTRQ
jgi:nucleoside-diphosphate-sugar epimerase